MSMVALITSGHKKGRHTMRLVEVAYDQARLDIGQAQMLNERGGEFQAWIIKGIRRFSVKQPDYASAQAILGVDFITPEEVAKSDRYVVYTGEEIKFLTETIPSVENLRWCRDNGYAVMPSPPAGFFRHDISHNETVNFYLRRRDYWESEDDKKFFRLKNRVSFGWFALRKTPVESPEIIGWGQQKKFPLVLEQIPNVAIVPWLIETYCKVREEIFKWPRTRMSNLKGIGDPGIGRFDNKGLLIIDLYNKGAGRTEFSCLASAWKFATYQQS